MTQQSWFKCWIVLLFVCKSLKIQSPDHYHDDLTFNRETGTPATDTAPPAGLVKDCLTLVSYLAPLHENVPFLKAKLHAATTHNPQLVTAFWQPQFGHNKAAHWSLCVWPGRGANDTKGDEKKKKEQLSKGLDSHSPVRGCRAGNQSYIVLYKASWGRCVNGIATILTVTSQ